MTKHFVMIELPEEEITGDKVVKQPVPLGGKWLMEERIDTHGFSYVVVFQEEPPKELIDTMEVKQAENKGCCTPSNTQLPLFP